MLIEPVKLNNTRFNNIFAAIYDFNKNADRLGVFLIYLHLLSLHVQKKKVAIQPYFIIKSGYKKNISLLENLFNQVELNCPVLPAIKRENESDVFDESDFAWCWPATEDDKYGFNFDSTNQHYYYYKKYGSVPPLIFKEENILSAKNFLEKVNTRDSLVIAVHLKYQNGDYGRSNADLNEWRIFFQVAVGAENCIFVLLGRDTVKNQLSGIDKLIFSSEHNLSIETELALISEADFFMGMSSGLCQMAIFESKPYSIFKNPGHHVEQMIKENIISDRLPFAGDHQKFLIEWDTEKVLHREFKRMVNFIKGNRQENY